jgi:hypothetical protein
MAAVLHHNCGNDFAIIASVGMSAARNGVFLKEATSEQKSALAHPSGDHLTFLNVYNQWLVEKSVEWSDANGVRHDVLLAADELLAKVRHACAGSMKQTPILLQDTPAGSDSTEGLLRSLVHALFRNVAHANDPHSTKAGFTLVTNFTNDPVCDAMINRSTCVAEKRDSPMNTIIYSTFGRAEANGKVKNSVTFVTLLPDGMLEEEAKVVLKGNEEALGDLREMLQMTKRIKEVIELATFDKTLLQRDTIQVIQKNMAQVKHEFPLASIKFVCDKEKMQEAEVRIMAPEICFESVKKRVVETLKSATPTTLKIKAAPEAAQKWFSAQEGGRFVLSDFGASEVNQLKEKLGDCVKVSYDGTTVYVQTLKSISSIVSKRIQGFFPAPAPPPTPTYKLKVTGFTSPHSASDLQTAISNLTPPIHSLSASPVAAPVVGMSYGWLNFADQATADAAKLQLDTIPTAVLSARALKASPAGPVRIESREGPGSASGSPGGSAVSTPDSSPRPPIVRSACLFNDKETRLRVLYCTPPDQTLMSVPAAQHEKEVFMLRLANFIVTQTRMFICNARSHSLCCRALCDF